MRTRVFALAGALVLGGAALAAAAEEGSLRFETTVPWRLDRLQELGATVGPVKVRSVEFSRGGGSIGDSIASRIRGGGGSDTQTTLRAAFDTENALADEWVVTYTLDFLDAHGKLIDRASKSKGFEGEAAVYKLEHSILEYVVPMIAKVKIRLEARLD
jgi:hypothetical protein